MLIEFMFERECYSKHFIILCDKKEVGKISIRDDDIVCIESIFIYDNFQRKGIGRAVVEKLLEKYSSIHGCSSPLAIGFWKKVGAEFEYPVLDEIIYELFDMGEYPPFIIQG